MEELKFLSVAREGLDNKIKDMMMRIDARYTPLKESAELCIDKCRKDIHFQELFARGLVKEDGVQVASPKMSEEESSKMNNHVTAFNDCQESCIKDINRVQFVTEFQLREFQINLNDCYRECRYMTNMNVIESDCIANCFKRYEDLLPLIENRIYKEIDLNK